MQGYAVFSRQLQDIDDRSDIGTKSTLMEHNALWLTRRTRRIDHVGEVVGRSLQNRFCALGQIRIVYEERLYCSQFKSTLLLFHRQHVVGGNHDTHLRVFHHVTQTLVGIFHVQRSVCGGSLMDGQDRNGEQHRTFQHHANEIIGADTSLHQ